MGGGSGAPSILMHRRRSGGDGSTFSGIQGFCHNVHIIECTLEDIYSCCSKLVLSILLTGAYEYLLRRNIDCHDENKGTDDDGGGGGGSKGREKHKIVTRVWTAVAYNQPPIVCSRSPIIHTDRRHHRRHHYTFFAYRCIAHATGAQPPDSFL